jgi:alpha-amylase/alpha-mannosidase (GH57 family)
MPPVHFAILWHQHQPYYPDDVSGETLMPWVRLHGTKDYFGMAKHLLEVPEFRCTVNLVPSLLVQILRYTESGGSDRHLDLCRRPADSLNAQERAELLTAGFMCNAECMIRPYPRFQELHAKRGVEPVEKVVSRFTNDDIRDLQCWSNLTWIHELAFEGDNELKQFREKGRGFTEKEKAWLLERQLDILRQVIPLHKKLADSGQVELTTTPFYHPILPLLWDKTSARQAMPDCLLPKHLERYPDDARRHLRQGVAYHEKIFGKRPRGMWPSEGSVSQDILEAITDVGIEWIATDEEILARSTNGWVARDGQGHARHPDLLYRPWNVEAGKKPLQIVFRDHALSDLIGFHYQRSEAHHAVQDLMGRVLAIGRAVASSGSNRPALVPIILDGENCWEYYRDGGVEFLRRLYKECVRNERIRPLTLSESLKESPAVDTIGHLFSGSWISHNFAIWIGHHEDNTAWDLLHATREFLKQTEATGLVEADALEKAQKELDIAQGSDWFWWFGDDHSSAQDAVFDQLFRRHLINVYRLLGTNPPNALNRPITRADHRLLHSQPTGLLPVRVSGRATYFEWISAGKYISGSERGTMTLVTEGLIKRVFFGFSQSHLFIRADSARKARDDFKTLDELRVRFQEPAQTEIRVKGLETRTPIATLYRQQKEVSKANVNAAVDRIFEVGVALEDLKLKEGDRVTFFLDCLSKNRSLDRAPQEGMIELTVPSPDFELFMWQV